MRKLPAVHPNSREQIMHRITTEITSLHRAQTDPIQKRVELVLLGTLFDMTLQLFDWLPPEQQSEILTACGTWYDIGLLLGKCPERMKDILCDHSLAAIDIDIPDWVSRPRPTE